MAYTVYCHTNKTNGKKYVGITSQKPMDRWNNGKHYERHKAFYADIVKFGWDNFQHEILFENLTETEAQEKEVELIEAWELLNADKGYNKTRGGKTIHLNDDAIEKLRARFTGDKNPFFNQKHTDETKMLMRRNRPKKQVICFDTGNVYESTREAERQTGAYHGDISKCCKGTLNVAGGKRWEYV